MLRQQQQAGNGKRGVAENCPAPKSVSPPSPHQPHSCGKHKKLLICTSQKGKGAAASGLLLRWLERKRAQHILPSCHPAIQLFCHSTILPFVEPKMQICSINKFIMSCANVNVFANIFAGFVRRKVQCCSTSKVMANKLLMTYFGFSYTSQAAIDSGNT